MQVCEAVVMLADRTGVPSWWGCSLSVGVLSRRLRCTKPCSNMIERSDGLKLKCCCSTSPGHGIFSSTLHRRVQCGGDVRIPSERRLTHTVVSPGPDSLGLSFGGSMAERPTMTIVPIQGESLPAVSSPRSTKAV